MSADTGTIDTLCNVFTPDRRANWEAAIAAAGIAVKIRDEGDDGFAEPAAMVDRMDALGIGTLLMPTGDISPHAQVNPHDFEHMAARWEEMEALTSKWSGRFAALALVDPTSGMPGVRELRARLAEEWIVGLYIHTHTWDRRLDHADYYPYYGLCSELGVAAAMQTGTSGGLMPSECGRPMTVDRAALYFPETRFVLSHTGWPWVAEAVSLALKFPNVVIGTGSYPPKHWDPALVSFLRGPGARKVMFGTNFPTVGHRHALTQVDELDLNDATRASLLRGAARAVFTRLQEGAAA